MLRQGKGLAPNYLKNIIVSAMNAQIEYGLKLIPIDSVTV